MLKRIGSITYDLFSAAAATGGNLLNHAAAKLNHAAAKLTQSASTAFETLSDTLSYWRSKKPETTEFELNGIKHSGVKLD